MKKLALALVASSALVGAAQAQMSSGFYLGAGIGGASFTGEIKDRVAPISKNTFGSQDIFGSVFAGYTGFSNCVLYGLEVGYSYANDSAYASKVVNGEKLKAERDHLLNVAVRLGYKIAPATAAYVRLGLNSGKVKFTSAVRNAANQLVSNKDSKRITSFAPGFGFETALNRNLLARIEYTYDFGSSFTPKKINKAQGHNVKVNKMHRQQVMLGVAYKF